MNSNKVSTYMFCATLMTLILCGCTEDNNPSITWQILNPPIVFGEDVVLYCNASIAQHCCTNTATWMKDFDIIVHHGASIDTSKYIQKQRSDGFSLIITKFNEDDINHQYTCLYDFLSYSEVLKLNPDFMRYEPNKEEIKTNFTMSDNFIVADVLFEMIYPSPECNFVVNGEVTATNVTKSEETRIRLFYKMKLHLIREIKKNKCIDSINVAIHCTVGGDDMVVKENTTFYCQDTTTSYFSNKESTEKKTSLPIILASILTLCIAVISVIIWRKKENIFKAKSLNIEGGNFQSTIISEESEKSPLLPKHERSGLVSIHEIVETGTDSQGLVSIHEIVETGKDSQGKTGVICPAQKVIDVYRLVLYYVLNDKLYTQKIATNTKINCAREQRSRGSNNLSSSSSVPGISNASIADMADVIKASLFIPNWGIKKRSRVI